MGVTEIYLKLSVTFPDDPKVRALARYGLDGVLARDLYVQMCLHCKRLLTDGFVPDEQVGLLAYPLPPDHAKQLAKQLASVGLINEEPNGWHVLAYVKRNGTRDDVERLSEVRARSGYKGGTAPRKAARQRSSEAKAKQVASKTGASSNPYTETDTETETTASQNPLPPAASGGGTAAPTSKRGTRIPDDFAVTDDMRAWFATNCPTVSADRERANREHQKFLNHWRGKAGRDATKVDWPATWRNWMLRAEEEAPRGQRPAIQSRQEIDQRGTDEMFDRAMERAQKREAQAALTAGGDPA